MNKETFAMFAAASPFAAANASTGTSGASVLGTNLESGNINAQGVPRTAAPVSMPNGLPVSSNGMLHFGQTIDSNTLGGPATQKISVCFICRFSYCAL